MTSFQVFSGPAERPDLIQLSEPGDVEDSRLINKVIDGLTNKVMECVKKKLAKAQDCYCHYPDELENIKNDHDEILKKHLDWQDKRLSSGGEMRMKIIRIIFR